MKVKVLILTGYGINAEKELAWAFSASEADPVIMHLEDVIENKQILNEYQILGFPGGFSFGDHIASGRVYATIIKNYLIEELNRFIEQDKLIIGICNGFQIITKLGLLPNFHDDNRQSVSLIENESGHFENRWVWIKTENNPSPWLKDISMLYLPVRHGEGKLVVENHLILESLEKNNQIIFKYVNPNGGKAVYPYNPNGSTADIAGLCNKKGNVIGLMPHPEASIFKEHHPNWTEELTDVNTGCVKLFENAVDYFK